MKKASISYSKSPSGCEKARPLKYNEPPKNLNNLQCAPLKVHPHTAPSPTLTDHHRPSLSLTETLN